MNRLGQDLQTLDASAAIGIAAHNLTNNFGSVQSVVVQLQRVDRLKHVSRKLNVRVGTVRHLLQPAAEPLKTTQVEELLLNSNFAEVSGDPLEEHQLAEGGPLLSIGTVVFIHCVAHFVAEHMSVLLNFIVGHFNLLFLFRVLKLFELFRMFGVAFAATL